MKAAWASFSISNEKTESKPKPSEALSKQTFVDFYEVIFYLAWSGSGARSACNVKTPPIWWLQHSLGWAPVITAHAWHTWRSLAPGVSVVLVPPLRLPHEHYWHLHLGHNIVLGQLWVDIMLQIILQYWPAVKYFKQDYNLDDRRNELKPEPM